jgi:hypothetical protein
MALLYSDGFDLQDTSLRWVVSGTVGDVSHSTATRFGSGKAVTLAGSTVNANLSILRGFPASVSIYAGAAIQVGLESGNSSNDYTANLFGIYTNNGTSGQLYIRRLSTNAIVAYRGDPNSGNISSPSGTQIASTAPGVLDGNWHYIEVFATIHGTTGQLTVKVNGNTVINFTGNTLNTGVVTTIDAIRFRTGKYIASPNAVISIDDFYVCDATGTTNNTFLGDVRVQSLVPAAAGTYTQLTPTGAANNYANAGEVPYNNTTYNASSTVGQRDTYTLSDLATSTVGVLGMQSVAYMQKSDAGAASAKVALVSGGGLYYDTTQSLSTSATVYTQVRPTDPATAAAWTVAGANSLEAGMEVA